MNNIAANIDDLNMNSVEIIYSIIIVLLIKLNKSNNLP